MFSCLEHFSDERKVSRSSPTVLPPPAVTLEQTWEEWRLPVRSAPGGVPCRFLLGRGEGHSACDGQHSRPPSFPLEDHRELHVKRGVSHPSRLHGLLAPSSACLNRKTHELATAWRSEFRKRRFLVLAHLQQDSTVVVSCVWAGFAITTERTAHRHVRCQLDAAITWQVLGKDFDVLRILGWNVDVPEKGIPQDTRPCLTIMRSMGVALLVTLPLRVHEPRWRPNMSRGAWHPSHAASVIWSRNCSNVLKRWSGVVNSGVVVQWARATPAFHPE